MPLPVIANTVRVAVRGTCPSGQRWVNVLHCRTTTTPPTALEIGSLDGQVSKLYLGPGFTGGSQLLGSCPAAVTLDDITYTPLDGTSASIVYAKTGVGTGGATDSLPSQSAAGVKFNTGLRGRSKRGRVYLPPFVEGASDLAGRIPAATVNSILAQWDGFRLALPPLNWNHVVASYKLILATSVTTYGVDRNYHVQRRRRD